MSLIQLPNPNEVILSEQKSQPTCRQVVAVLVFNPEGAGICLTMSYKASTRRGDGRANLSPVQGVVGAKDQPEGLFEAGSRVAREELMVDLGKLVYLGSSRRDLDPSHPKWDLGFKTQHYHWLSGFSRSWRLLASDELDEAKWWTVSEAYAWARKNMSLVKGDMFHSALEIMFERSGHLIQHDPVVKKGSLVA